MQANTLFKELKISEFQQRLETSLKDFSVKDYSYIVKGDVSGIQDFIFSITSNKASKSLKGRSFFVQALSKLGIRLLQQHLGEENTYVFYDGGGNFYLLSKVPATQAIEDAQMVIDRDCRTSEIYLSLAEIPLDQSTFKEIWKKINSLSNETKLRKFDSDFFSFDPYPSPPKEIDPNTGDEFEQGFRYDKLTDESLRDFNRRYNFISAAQPSVDGEGLAFFGSKMVLKNGSLPMEDWVNGLPKWGDNLLKEHSDLVKKREEAQRQNPKGKMTIPAVGNIIEFADLAYFAKTRTGTDKIAVLKMDVDNLGSLFNGLKGWPDAKKTSNAMSWFFGAFISDLLKESFEYKGEDGKAKSAKFCDNIYVVFSGGDDTFMVGAWDAVFEFAYCLHRNFTDFVDEIQKQQIAGLPDKITLSAALVVVDPKFPVIRFAERAEEALNEAKRWEDTAGCRPKDRISVFGQILKWEEFEDSRSIGNYLAEMIKSGDASRSIIERIKRIASDYERLAERAADQQSVPGPKVYRLFYTLRKWTPASGKEESSKSQDEKFIEKTTQDFTNGLLQSFTSKQKVIYPKFPVAARWAEFLTRK